MKSAMRGPGVWVNVLDKESEWPSEWTGALRISYISVCVVRIGDPTERVQRCTMRLSLFTIACVRACMCERVRVCCHFYP